MFYPLSGELDSWVTLSNVMICDQDFYDTGTGNGMVKSLLDSVGEPCKAYNATLAIIRGSTWCLLIICVYIRIVFLCLLNLDYFIIDF